MPQSSYPERVLKEKSLIWNLPVDSLAFASRLDHEDPLSSFRSLFTFPKKSELPFGELLAFASCSSCCPRLEPRIRDEIAIVTRVFPLDMQSTAQRQPTRNAFTCAVTRLGCSQRAPGDTCKRLWRSGRRWGFTATSQVTYLLLKQTSHPRHRWLVSWVPVRLK